MTSCPWEEIHGFQSYSEFDRFVEWMNEQIKLGKAKEIEVNEPFLGSFGIRWFKHLASSEVWRLMEPDSPFRGAFEPVAKSD